MIRSSIEGTDDGFTLVELMVTLAIFTITLALVLTLLTNAQKILGTQQERSSALSQAQLGLEQVDREVRSGSVVRNPADETDPHYILRVLTQANSNNRCVQWRVSADGQLQRRHWDPSFGATPNPASVSPWRVVATNLVNRTHSVPPFTAALITTDVVRTLRVVFVVDENPGDSDSLPIRVQQSLSARNTGSNLPQPAPGPYVGTSTEPCQPDP